MTLAPKTPTSPVAHYYRQFREHQARVMASGGGTVTRYPTGRVELSYASAPYGEHALSAFTAAKRHIHFRRELSRA